MGIKDQTGKLQKVNSDYRWQDFRRFLTEVKKYLQNLGFLNLVSLQ